MSFTRLVSSFLAVSLFAGSATAGQFAAPPPPNAADRITEPVAIPLPVPMPPEVFVDRAAVRKALVARRAKSVKLFRDYWKRGVYPRNTFTDDKLNVWLDADGRLCAAATIIASSGFRDQVMEQANLDNFIRLVDVTDGWLMDWMLTSGLTQEELVAIQLPFDPVTMPGIEPIRPDPILADRVDARLRRGYVRVDRMLVKRARASLDVAVERLLERPDLARLLLAG